MSIGAGIANTDGGAASAARELGLFRGVVKSLARDASGVLGELTLQAGSLPEPVQEQLLLLGHYLDYMMRLCDGVA